MDYNNIDKVTKIFDEKKENTKAIDRMQETKIEKNSKSLLQQKEEELSSLETEEKMISQEEALIYKKTQEKGE